MSKLSPREEQMLEALKLAVHHIENWNSESVSNFKRDVAAIKIVIASSQPNPPRYIVEPLPTVETMLDCTPLPGAITVWRCKMIREVKPITRGTLLDGLRENNCGEGLLHKFTQVLLKLGIEVDHG